MQAKYQPEKYWSEVGERIESRTGQNVIAGDDEPYYRYKRQEFLKLLHGVHFANKSVLEIGCGPGGNLLEVLKHNPKSLHAVDISEQMIKLATEKLEGNAEILKINGTSIPNPDNAFDVVFTATVLQHNTDEHMLHKLMSEIARVAGDRVYFFEKIDRKITGDDLCHGRPVAYYEEFMKEHGFALKSTKFINIRISYFVCGFARKLLNPTNRKEGEPLTKFSLFVQKVTLPITKFLDKIFTSRKDVARLEFEKI